MKIFIYFSCSRIQKKKQMVGLYSIPLIQSDLFEQIWVPFTDFSIDENIKMNNYYEQLIPKMASRLGKAGSMAEAKNTP